MNFWRWLTTSRYTRRLEDENARLTGENERLLRLLLPRLNQTVLSVVGSGQSNANEVKHESNRDNRASSDANPFKFKRVNWTEARNKLELLNNQDIKTEARMQKAVNAHANL